MDTTNGKSDSPSLLLVDGDEKLCSVLAGALQKRGYEISVAYDYQSALTAAAEHCPENAIVEWKFSGSSGMCLIRKLVDLDAHMRIVVITGYGSIATAMEAVKLGAHYYLTKPVDADDIVAALHGEPGASPGPIGEKPFSVSRLQWEYIQRVLIGNKGNVSAAARVLGMHRRTLQRKLSKHPVRD